MSHRNAFRFSPYIAEEPAGLIALLIDLHARHEVLREVNTKILFGRDNFKLGAGFMIVIDDRLTFPGDALGFAFAVVKVKACRIRLRDQVRYRSSQFSNCFAWRALMQFL